MTDFISGKAAIAVGKPRPGKLKWELTKILRIMKLAAILLFAAAMHVSAKGLTQDKISLSLKNAPLEKAFGEIEAQSGFVFIYKDETVKDKRISIQVSNVTLSQALDECLKGQALSYQIVGKSVAIKAIRKNTDQIGGEPTGTPPLIDVKGKVLNEKGDPVEGVTVKVKGTEKFTMTDKDGEFSLVTVERDAVLVFTHITMEAFQLKVSGQTDLLIRLQTKVSSLGEVTVTVNTGYQQVSRERFVGSVTKLDSAAFATRAGMDIISRLDGMVPGILFDKKNTSNSRQLQSVQIRGLSTLTGLGVSATTEPLVIVDNFPFRQGLAAINPNDVESITILKDAAAASIWGAQAGNGVIVITTKKGKYNQKFTVSLTSNYSVQEKVDQYYYPNISVSDYIDNEIFLFNKGKYDADLNNSTNWPIVSPVVELLAKKRAGKISAMDSAEQIDAMRSQDLRRDLNKWVYRNAIVQQHYINLRGGSNMLNYSFSSGYNRELNSIRNSKPDDQFTLNTSVGIRPIKGLEIITGVNYSQSIQRSATFNMPSRVYPYAQLADAEGHPLVLPNLMRVAYLDTAGGGNLLDWQYRPLDEVTLSDNKSVTKLIGISLGAVYKFTDWLGVRVNYQFNDQSSEGNNYYDIKTYTARNLINTYTNLTQTLPQLRNPLPKGGIFDVSQFSSRSQNVRGQLDFNKTIFNEHMISAIVAAEISETKTWGDKNRFYGFNRSTGSYASTIDYLTLFPTYNNLFGNQVILYGNTYVGEGFRRFVSFLGNVSYTYKGRYTLYGSARKDGSNVFGVNTNRKWKPLWSAGVSWDVAKENFFHVAWLPALRIRSSFGYSGNPGNANGLPVINYDNLGAELTNLPRASISTAPNPNLRWEKVEIANIAVDFGAFKNRLTGSIDIYAKKSTDILWVNPPAPSTGVVTYLANAADLKGNGFELTLNSKNTIGAVKWQTGFNFSHAKTVVQRVLLTRYNTNDYINYSLNPSPGKIAYGIASYRWGGLDPLTGDPRGYYGKQLSTNYTSILADSLENQKFHGSAIPLYFGNLTNSISWKSLTLYANITYRLNFYYRKPSINYYRLANSWEGNADYALRWQKPGDEKITNVPSVTYPLNSDRDRFYTMSEINVLRGDNIRFDDLRLQYVYPVKKMNSVIKSMQFSLAVNRLNVIIWKKDKSDYDPDYTGGTSFVIPPSKMWTGAVNIAF
jgi:TonB-dependent starch-binding outer membrane protein SusC